MHRPSCMGRLGQRSEHAPCADDGTTGRASRFRKWATMYLIKKRALIEGARYARPVRVWCHLRAPLPGTTTTRTPSHPQCRFLERRATGGHVQAVRDRTASGGAVFGFVADWCVSCMTDCVSKLASSTRTQGSNPDGAFTDPPRCRNAPGTLHFSQSKVRRVHDLWLFRRARRLLCMERVSVARLLARGDGFGSDKRCIPARPCER